MNRATAPARGQDGFTLIELVVSLALAGLVLTVVGGMLINSLRAEAVVRSAAEATNLGQLISRSVQTGVRNASHVQLTTNVDDSQLLIVRTADRGTPLTWSCQAWYYSPDDDGTLYTTRTSPAAAIPAPTPTTLGSWTLLGDGVAVGGPPVFDGLSTRITLDLDIEAGDRPPVSINTTATTRTLATESAPCF